MINSTDSLADFEEDLFVPDEREDIEGHACKALNIESRMRGGHHLRSTKDAMPNTSLMSCREPLMNESIAAAFEGFDPKDEQERVQCKLMLVASEHVLDCFIKAKEDGLDPERRDAELKHAEKLVSGVIRLSDALDKHRGKGEQKITVERVYGNQAIVGNVNTRAANGFCRDRYPDNRQAKLNDDSFAAPDGEMLAEELNVRQRTRGSEHR